MLKHLRKLSFQTLIYGIGDAITRLAAIILLPLYTHLLTPEDYGKLAIITLVTTISGLILEAGQRTAFFRFYFLSESKEDIYKLTSTAFFYLIFSALLLLPIMLVFSKYLGGIILKDTSFIWLVQISLISVFFDIGSIIPFAIFRAEQKSVQYAILSIVRFLVNVTASIIAVALLRLGIIGAVYANVTTSIIFFIICLVWTLPKLKWVFNLQILKQLLIFGFPLIPANLAGWSLTFSDRFFLQEYSTLSQVGVYAVAYSVAGFQNMSMGWYNTAWAPYCFSIFKHPDASITYARLFTYAMVVFSALGIGISLFSNEFLVIFTRPGFYQAATVVPLIVGSYLFYEGYYLISLGFDLTGKTVYSSFIIGTGAIVNIFLNIILIPRMAMMGAALATFISYLVLPILALPVVNRFYKTPFELTRILKLGLVTMPLLMLSIFLPVGWNLEIFCIKLLSLFLWVGILLLMKFFTSQEISSFLEFVHSLIIRYKPALLKINANIKPRN